MRLVHILTTCPIATVILNAIVMGLTIGLGIAVAVLVLEQLIVGGKY
jgi:hypothetical protein